MANWDRAWRNGSLRTYDQNYMLDAIHNLNDPNVRQELINSKFLREDGGWNYGSAADAAGAVNAWASGNGLSLYQGGAATGGGPGIIPTVSFGPENAWQTAYTQGGAEGAAPMGARFYNAAETPDPENRAGTPGTETKTGTPAPAAPGVEAPVVASFVTDTPTPAPASTTPGGQQTTWTQQPEWMDGGYNLGWTWTGNRWVQNAGTMAKGHVVGSEVGWQSGMALPVDYTATQDTYRGGLGGNETAIHKAIRMANDLVKNGQANSPQRALEYAMAFVQAEAKRAGQTTGWDMNVLKDQLGAYNENINYFTGQPGNPGVNPVTGGAGGTGGGGAGSGGGTGGTGGAGAGDGGAGDTNADPTGQFGRNTAYATDEDARNDYVLRQLGIDPDNGGLYLNSILRTIGPALTNFIQLQGISGNTNEGPLQNTQGNLDRFAGWLNGPEGMAGLRNWAQEQMRGVAGPSQGPAGLRDMTDANAQINTLGKLLETSMFGVNPILTQAYADYFDKGRRGYRDYNIGQMGKGSITNPIDWLLGSEWGDLING